MEACVHLQTRILGVNHPILYLLQHGLSGRGIGD
jgi:hypothetical protein